MDSFYDALTCVGILTVVSAFVGTLHWCRIARHAPNSGSELTGLMLLYWWLGLLSTTYYGFYCMKHGLWGLAFSP